MRNINVKILEDSNFVEDCYAAQTKAFAPAEYIFLKDLIHRHRVKKVLDVGTGNGIFICGLAEHLPHVSFDAIDADGRLINKAKEKNRRKNISYTNALFDSGFMQKEYDLIHARFAVEHMPDVSGFISEAYKRLNKGGFLLVTEYFISDNYNGNEIWKLFRQKEYEFYRKFGSHPRISADIPKLYKDSGFSEIDSIFRHISPSTVDRHAFYELVKTYAILYNNLDPETFTDDIKLKMIEYSDHAARDDSKEDGLLISHTTGRKLTSLKSDAHSNQK